MVRPFRNKVFSQQTKHQINKDVQILYKFQDLHLVFGESMET